MFPRVIDVYTKHMNVKLDQVLFHCENVSHSVLHLISPTIRLVLTVELIRLAEWKKNVKPLGASFRLMSVSERTLVFRTNLD